MAVTALAPPAAATPTTATATTGTATGSDRGGSARPRWDLLVAVMGAPYSTDATSTMLRWVAATAQAGRRVQVWTCGYATLLTQRNLGRTKESNALEWGTTYPTSSAHVEDLLERHPGLRWLSCRFCSSERGALDHLDAVQVRPALSFGNHVRESAKTVFVGLT